MVWVSYADSTTPMCRTVLLGLPIIREFSHGPLGVLTIARCSHRRPTEVDPLRDEYINRAHVQLTPRFREIVHPNFAYARA